MSDNLLKKQWEDIIIFLNEKFQIDGDIDMEGILYLIGLQELGQIHENFKKEEKVNLIHIGVCSVLEPYGYYEFDFYDENKWPHFKLKQKLPLMKSGEQTILLKEAIINYFLNKKVIE